MYCLRCGTKVDTKTEYCPHCGANIKKELSRYDYTPRKEDHKTPTINLDPSHEEQFSYSIKYSFGNEEELVKEYVGKNYDKIKTTKFSWPTFLLGPIYLLYRKLYSFALTWLLTIIIFSLLTPFFSFIIQLGLALLFPKIYLETVQKRVLEIKKKNQHLTKEDIKKECRKKGGVNIIIPLFIFIMMGMTLFLTVAIFQDLTEPEKQLKKETTDKIGKLEYTIPKEFKEESYNSSFYKSYSYNKNYNYCNIYFSIIDKNIYHTKEEFLQVGLLETEKTKPTDTITINGRNWLHLNLDKEYSLENYYVLENKEKQYKINTYSNQNSELCNQYFNKILNSIIYKE